MNRRSFLQRIGLGIAGAALQGNIIFRNLVPVPELVVEKINYFHGSFAQFLAPGLREIFVKYLTENGPHDIFKLD